MRTLIALLIFLGLATPGFTQEPDIAQKPDRQAIQSLITDQIAALQVDDFSAAFSLASPMIKGIFGNPENFGAMVKQGYPMVYRPKSVRMLGVRQDKGLIWQRVMITDSSGNTHLLDYQMIKAAEGWQINGVQLLPQSGVGA
jgi:hypothetical protein